MKSIRFLLSVLALVILPSERLYADTFFEVSVGAGQMALDITSKRGDTFADDTSVVNFALAAYRQSTEKSAWGAVIEYSQPVGRDDLPGNGTIIGFRPINYMRYIGRALSFELYAGAAQYDWLKTANGYYFGTGVRYSLIKRKLDLGVDAKYYQDLAYDSPTGDDIVDGFNTSLKLHYRF